MDQPMFIYSDYYSSASVTATDTKTGLDIADVLLAEEDNVWMPANTTGAKEIVIDLGIEMLVGAVAIAGDWLAGVSLTVSGSTDNFVASDIALSADSAMVYYTANYRKFNAETIRYVKLTLTGLGSSSGVAYIAVHSGELLPWFNDGFDPDPFMTTGSAMVSPDGRFLGSSRQRTMREVSIDPGEVLPAEYVLYRRWAEVCIRRIQPFFLVPDSSQAACYFSWCKPEQEFKAPMVDGMNRIVSLTVLSRVA